TRTQQWRLVTSLLDPAAYPAAELVALYHERWQAETAYYSIKATMLHGRVLRSRTLPGIDQEVWALLAACQALIRAAADTAATRPGLDTDQISLTILLHTARDLITTATGILPASPAGPADLAGAIGRAALAGLLPARRPPRIKARTRKNPTSKYRHPSPHDPPAAQAYTIHAQITFFEEGLAPRARR
ncbi:MAG: transposase, partial [Streptosporangiaceae bacterium]